MCLLIEISKPNVVATALMRRQYCLKKVARYYLCVCVR